MNHEFKPGDLAVIFGCTSQPSLNGSCAEILRAEGLFSFAGMPEEPWYFIRVGASENHARVGVLFPLAGDIAAQRQKSQGAPA